MQQESAQDHRTTPIDPRPQARWRWAQLPMPRPAGHRPARRSGAVSPKEARRYVPVNHPCGLGRDNGPKCHASHGGKECVGNRSRPTRRNPLWLLPSGPDQVGGRKRPTGSHRAYGDMLRGNQAVYVCQLTSVPVVTAGRVIIRQSGTSPQSAKIVGVGLNLQRPYRRRMNARGNAIFLGIGLRLGLASEG